MNAEIGLIFLLCVILAYQQWFFTRQIQLLIDKMMSKNFAEYNQAKTPLVAMPTKIPMDVPEDLRALQEFSFNL